MSDLGFWNQGTTAGSVSRGLSPEGRWAIALGIVALLVGLGAVVGGAYVALRSTGALMVLPGGLPPTTPESVALFMCICGGVTALLGAVSIYKAHDL